MKNFRLFASTAVLLAIGCATPVHLRPWIEVRAPGFQMLSGLSEEEVLEVVRDLEVLKAIVELVTGEAATPGAGPLRVYAFDSRAAYRPFQVSLEVGRLDVSMRQSTIVFRAAETSRKARRILRHEYVLYLLSSQRGRAYPPWFSEGLASVLSDFELTGEGIRLGRAPKYAPYSPLSGTPVWISVDDLISRRNLDDLRGDEASAFQTESWALVHYLVFREGAKIGNELSIYVAALQAGVADDEAIRRAFGRRPDALGHTLRKYLEVTRLPHAYLPFEPAALVRPSLRVRALAAADVAIALGELSVRMGRNEQAEYHYAAALSEDPGSARALVGLARALAGQQRMGEAESYYQEALERGIDDAVVQLEYANYLHARAVQTEGFTERAKLARQARERYARSRSLDDSVPEAFAGFGATFLLDGQEAARGLKSLEHAHELLPSSLEITLTLAQLYRELGRRDDAHHLARRASIRRHSEVEGAAMRALLGSVRGATLRQEPSPGNY